MGDKLGLLLAERLRVAHTSGALRHVAEPERGRLQVKVPTAIALGDNWNRALGARLVGAVHEHLGLDAQSMPHAVTAPGRHGLAPFIVAIDAFVYLIDHRFNFLERADSIGTVGVVSVEFSVAHLIIATQAACTSIRTAISERQAQWPRSRLRPSTCAHSDFCTGLRPGPMVMRCVA